MRMTRSKSAMAGLAVMALSAAVISAPTPVAAGFRMGGGGFGVGWRGGYGGYRGYGYGGYGYRRYGYGYGGGGYPGWGYGGWGWGFPWWGWGYGPGWGSDAYYAGDGYYGGGDNGCWSYRRVWSQPGGRGHYLGRRLVNACQ